MRLFLCGVFILITQIGFTQVRELESQLKVAEDELLLIEQERNQLRNDLFNAGQETSNNPEVIALNEKLKAKKKEVKALKKQIKQAVKDGNTNAVINANPPQSKQPNSEPISIPTQTNQSPARELPDIQLSTLLFGKFETTVSQDYDLYINSVVKQMQRDETLLLRINAFTDNSEKSKIAKELTDKMATAVATEFVRRGIPSNRLILTSNGSSKSVSDNSTLLGQARNRRVELSFQ